MADSLEAFFIPRGDEFVSTPWTQGPWDSNLQHAGPPSALMGRAIELADPRPDSQIARVTVEILRPIPLVPLTINAQVVRGGRSVELIEGSMTANGEELMRARAWRIRTEDVGVDDIGFDREVPPGPETGRPMELFDTGSDFGYGKAMEWLFVSGAFLEPGPATAWMRMRYPLVPGETPTPLTRVLIAADSGNGISATLDFYRYLFINTELTVHLARLPEGDWVCLDAATSVGRHGVGLTETRLFDEHAWIGRAAQSLMIGLRGK
jgi:hypothetical protein